MGFQVSNFKTGHFQKTKFSVPPGSTSSVFTTTTPCTSPPKWKRHFPGCLRFLLCLLWLLSNTKRTNFDNSDEPLYLTGPPWRTGFPHPASLALRDAEDCSAQGPVAHLWGGQGEGKVCNFALKPIFYHLYFSPGTSNHTSRKYRQKRQRRKRGETKKVSKVSLTRTKI